MGNLMCCGVVSQDKGDAPGYDKIPTAVPSNGAASCTGPESGQTAQAQEESSAAPAREKKSFFGRGGAMGDVQLSETELSELKDIFAMFDKDNSGSIDINELESMVASLGINASKEDLNDMIAEADIDQSGTIEFDEFKTLIGPHFQKEKPPEDYIDAFKFFDKDGDGFISRTELRHIMNTVDANLAEADIEEMIKEADANGDGKIDFDEFIKMMHHQ